MASAEIITIGTELLLGELVDTNAGRIARTLRQIGIDVYHICSVGDNTERIATTIDRALDRTRIVITSGGLGPTVDDVTREAVAKASGRALVYSDVLEEQIAARFRRFGRPMSDNNRRQAWIPEGALAIDNPVGTAPCFAAEDTRGRGVVISLPGVPHEVEHLLEQRIVPLLLQKTGGGAITRVKVLRTCGIGESRIDNAIGDLMAGENPTVGLAAHIGETDVRITAKAADLLEANRRIEEMEALVRSRLGVAIYGTGSDTLAEVTGRHLARRGLRLGIMDALSGQRVVAMLTRAGYASLIAPSESLVLSDRHGDAGTPEDARLLERISGEAAAGISTSGMAGVAIVGPSDDAIVAIGAALPEENPVILRRRLFEDNPRGRHWIALQALDLLRRLLIGTLHSPVD